MSADAEFLIHSEHELMERFQDLEKRGLLRLEALPARGSVVKVRVSEISKAAAAELLAFPVRGGAAAAKDVKSESD